MKVNVISESAFTVQGHGVHTAFTENADVLRAYTDCEVMMNGRDEADIIHIHTIGPYALRHLLFGKGVKIISAHVTPDSFVGSLVGAQYWHGFARWYLKWVYNLADAVLAVSHEVVDELNKIGVRKPVYLVPNTIKTEAFFTTKSERDALRAERGIDKKAFVVLGCGQVQPRKRIDSFVAAAKALPELTFIWAGGIPFKKMGAEAGPMQKIMKNPPANVLFTGVINRNNAVAYFKLADVFFLPSMQETFGIVVVEAAAVGMPVVLRDNAQYEKTFEGGYEAGNDESFAEIIKRLSKDPSYYERCRMRAKERIALRYDGRSGAVRLLEVYEEVMSIKKAAR